MVSNSAHVYSRVQHPDARGQPNMMSESSKDKVGLTSSRFYRSHVRSFKCNTLLYCIIIALATYGIYYLVYWRKGADEEIGVGMHGAENGGNGDFVMDRPNPKFGNGVEKQVLQINDRKGYDRNEQDDDSDFVDNQLGLQNRKHVDRVEKGGVDQDGEQDVFEEADNDFEGDDDDDNGNDGPVFHAVLVENEHEGDGEGGKNKGGVKSNFRLDHHNQEDIKQIFHAQLIDRQNKHAVPKHAEVHINPDYRAVEEHNKNPQNKPKLPKFKPNLHIPQNAHEFADKVPHPKPKEFPVRLLHTPNPSYCPRGPFVLIVVLSGVRESATRSTIRKTWASPNTFKAPHIEKSHMGWWVIFAIGNDDNKMDVQSENAKSGDILQGDFIDLESEETRKLMMAMSWLYSLQGQQSNCHPTYVLKTNSHIFVNGPLLTTWMFTTLHQLNNVYVGQVLHEDTPIRDVSRPHYVPYSDYSKEFFPDLVRGPTFLLSIDVVYRMVPLFSTVTPVAMDDSYIGILAAQLGIKPRNDERFIHLKRPTNVCSYRHMMFVHGLSASEHRHVFSVLVGKSGRHCLNEGLK